MLQYSTVVSKGDVYRACQAWVLQRQCSCLVHVNNNYVQLHLDSEICTLLGEAGAAYLNTSLCSNYGANQVWRCTQKMTDQLTYMCSLVLQGCADGESPAADYRMTKGAS